MPTGQAAGELGQVAELVQERYLGDLGEQLQQLLCLVSLQGTCQPSKSFRFRALKFPEDVDLEEYVLLEESDLESRSRCLQLSLFCICKDLRQMRPPLGDHFKWFSSLRRRASS